MIAFLELFPARRPLFADDGWGDDWGGDDSSSSSKARPKAKAKVTKADDDGWGDADW
mgnify:CR=1 FL=1